MSYLVVLGRTVLFCVYSPEGPAKVVPTFAGAVKLGEPSEFHTMTSAIVYLVESHAPAELASALKVFQIWVPSGDVKNLHGYQ
jgi:hypothetical protein